MSTQAKARVENSRALCFFMLTFGRSRSTRPLTLNVQHKKLHVMRKALSSTISAAARSRADRRKGFGQLFMSNPRVVALFLNTSDLIIRNPCERIVRRTRLNQILHDYSS